jgi:hypothetical protein
LKKKSSGNAGPGGPSAVNKSGPITLYSPYRVGFIAVDGWKITEEALGNFGLNFLSDYRVFNKSAYNFDNARISAISSPIKLCLGSFESPVMVNLRKNNAKIT